MNIQNLSHSLFIFENEMGRKPDINNLHDKAIIGFIEIGVRYSLNGELLTKNDLDHLHDVLVDSIDIDFPMEIVQKIWLREVPFALKADALHWGASDTVVRDDFFKWTKKNKEILEKYSVVVE